MTAEHTEVHKGYKIEIHRDDSGIDSGPQDWQDETAFIAANHRDFYVIPKWIRDIDEVQYYQDTHDIYPLIAYIHSGVALSLSRDYPFNCPWDSGQVGWVVVNRSECPDTYKYAQGMVEEWNQYLSGDVWGYVVSLGTDEDSCWGFYGYENCLTEAKSVVDWHIKRLSVDYMAYA